MLIYFVMSHNKMRSLGFRLLVGFKKLFKDNLKTKTIQSVVTITICSIASENNELVVTLVLHSSALISVKKFKSIGGWMDGRTEAYSRGRESHHADPLHHDYDIYSLL